MSRSNVVSAETLWVSRSALTLREELDAAREAREAAAFLAVAAHQRYLAHALQIGDAVEAVAGELAGSPCRRRR